MRQVRFPWEQKRYKEIWREMLNSQNHKITKPVKNHKQNLQKMTEIHTANHPQD